MVAGTDVALSPFHLATSAPAIDIISPVVQVMITMGKGANVMPGTDITASQRTIDPKIARMLAAFIRDNMDDLVSECVLRYHEDYAFSANSEIPVSDSERWSRGNLASLVTQLEECRPNPREYEYMTGDIVVQHFELLYGIDAFLEQCVFEAGVVAELIWERTIGDTRRLNVMLDALEAFTQARIVANLESFAQSVSQPRTLIRAWRLGHYRFAQPSDGEAIVQPQVTTGDGTSARRDRMQTVPPDPLGALTPRERDVATLADSGKSNKETASMLGLQLSTVRNTLSRVYDKLGVAGRSGLILALTKQANR